MPYEDHGAIHLHRGHYIKPAGEECCNEVEKGNVLKAIHVAIDEFANNGAIATKLDAPINNNENRRLIIIFTNHFDIDLEDEEVLKIILKLHAFRINLMIFGYEIGTQVGFRNMDIDNPYADTKDEEKVLKFLKMIDNFDLNKEKPMFDKKLNLIFASKV